MKAGPRRIIRTDGSEALITGPISTADAAKLINAGAKGVDVVTLHQFGFPLWVMLVDGSGHTTDTVDHGNGHIELVSTGHTKPVNPKATELYRKSRAGRTNHVIVGDVAILPDDDFA